MLVGIWALSGEVQLGLIAAGVAFYSIFAIFPAVAALIAIFGLLADPTVIETQLVMMEEIIPVEAYELLREQLNLMLATRPETLGFATLLSTFVALFSARNGVASLILGLNQIYGRPNRNGLRQLAVAILLTLSLISIAVMAMLVVVIAPILIKVLPLERGTGWLLEAIRWIAAFGIVLAGLGVLYRFGPNMRGARGRWITPGAFLVILFWLVASAGFSFYLANFGNYNEVYGSIGAVIALLMWLYISAFLVLLGAAVNVVWQRSLRSEKRPDDLGLDIGPRQIG
ncbi:YihY/virulence factor BrkB family protein [Limimaricola cinnabarinus]|uniref:Inner membrane protein YihY, formerly thought to be RNase BN n=1 Tax=Limimaricola cinnabarinus LL-001 TaxID=1337093 RepID=U2Z431_9RHOB|nr:YihY/virulence factor BrkB family protein [Limimaricola cinnabarinus]GAD56145.1 inner membrane protein YihY, formerly thought to be RNase BN [Limimaricola cinnabarinus LL-001]